MALQTSHNTTTASLQRELDQLLGRPPVGNDLHLTLDADLQRIALDGLGDRNGAVVLIELETGAVRVLASQPGFDPNTLVTTNAAERAAATAAPQAMGSTRSSVGISASVPRSQRSVPSEYSVVPRK